MCIGFRGVYLIAERNSRRKTYLQNIPNKVVHFNINTFDCDVIPQFSCSLKPDYFSKLVDSKTSVRINSD